MIIDNETITVYNKSSSETMQINTIKDVKIYDDIIAIYTSAITAHIVPIRYLDKDLKDNFIKKVSNV